MTLARTYLFSTLVLLPAFAAAQAPPLPGRPLSLEDALALAQERNEQITIARAGVDRAGGEQVRARSERYPQLSASASYDRALASEFSGLFDQGAGSPGCAPFVPPPGASLDARVAELERAVDCGATGPAAGSDFGNLEDLPFGRRNTYRVNLAFSQNLYSGGRIAAQSAIAEAGRASAELTLATTRAQLALDVVRAYYDAALAGRLLEIAEATYKQADATLAQTRLGYQAGSQPEFELLRAQVSRDNLVPDTIRRRSERDIALLRLRQLLDIPAGEQLALSTPLDGETLPPPAPFAAAVSAAVAARPPDTVRATVRQAETGLRQSEAAVDVARAQRLPSISITSSYGEVAYGATPAFGDFRRNWNVGAVVQVPVLTGGRLRADEVVARANVAEAQARLQQARELAVLDSETAFEELKAALAAWEASAGTVSQARRAYEIAELRYREGVSTQLELSDARLLLVQAEAGRAQSARDLQVARARVALLPDLPVGTGQGAPQTPAATQPATQIPSTPRPAITTPAATGTAPRTGTGGME
jgi:outer membrane protein TolC